MEKVFNCLSWNVENFGNNSRDRCGNLKPQFKNKVLNVTQRIKAFNPDVFSLYEIRGKDVFNEFMEHFSGYTFYITEGKQSQEILVGIKGTFTSFVTQKIEFKSGVTALRPGLLVTLIIEGEKYVLLFVHLKSLKSPVGWGLRNNMFERIRGLKKALNKAFGNDPSKVNFLVIGDFNTMGMNYTFGDKDISGKEELTRMKKMASSGKYKMKILSKTHDYSYYNGSSSKLKGNLDHVFASDHLKFKKFDGAEVQVSGLTDYEIDSVEQDQWIEGYSDHASLFFEVHK